jgi:hypothetical protein
MAHNTRTPSMKTQMPLGGGGDLALFPTPLTRAHRGCHGSEALATPFIKFTDEISESASNVTLYVNYLCSSQIQWAHTVHTYVNATSLLHTSDLIENTETYDI